MPTLHRVDDQTEIPDRLPVIALRDLVFFPYMVLPLLIGRPPSVAALTAADASDRLLVVVAQKDIATENPTKDDVHRVGAVVRVIEVTRLPDGTARVVFEGLGRVRVPRLLEGEDGFRGAIDLLSEHECEVGEDLAPEAQALIRGTVLMYD